MTTAASPPSGERDFRVAVVIVGYRNSDDIVTCLTALARSTWTDFEVVIVENGGAAAFAALCAAVPERLASGQGVRRVQAPGNLGFAGGVNLGIRDTASADAWLILNPDTEMEPEALGALVARLRRGGCEAVGGVVYGPGGRVQAYGGVWQRWFGRGVSLGWGAPLGSPVDAAWVERRQTYLLGTSMLVSRRFIERAGTMREDYFLYCEEVEWFLRAGRAGLRLGFAPDARILHQLGTTTGAGEAVTNMPRMPVYLAQRNSLLLTRDLTPARVPVTAVLAILVIVGRYARRGAWRQCGYALAGWWAGLLDRRGPPA